MRSKLAALVAASLLSTAGCGDDGSSEDVDSRGDDAQESVTTTDASGTDDGTTPGSPYVIDRDADHVCDGEIIEVAGEELGVTIDGRCGAVAISGSDNDVNVAATELLAVGGTGQDVEAGSVDVLTVTGSDNDVDIATHVGSVAVTGTDHDIDCPGPVADVNDTSTGSDIDCRPDAAD